MFLKLKKKKNQLHRPFGSKNMTGEHEYARQDYLTKKYNSVDGVWCFTRGSMSYYEEWFLAKGFMSFYEE